MAIITFEAVSAKIFGGTGEQSLPKMSYRVRVKGQEVALTTGEKLSDLVGHITLNPGDAERPRTVGEATGMMSYFSAGFPTPIYHIEVWIARGQLEELLHAARFSRIPSKVHVEVEGMEPGWATVGGETKWDNERSRSLNVESLNFELPLFMPIVDDEDGGPAAAAMPPTGAQIDKLTLRVDRLAAEMKRELRALLWSVVFVAAVLVLFAWNR